MNEWAWRNLSDDGWVYFKIFFVAPLSLLFMAAQIPITLRGRTDNAD
jgi:intracellular septation protein